jgi:hypothetical protein
MEAPLTIRIFETDPRPPRDEEAIHLVRRWPRLSAAAKLAWENLMDSELGDWEYGVKSLPRGILHLMMAMGVSESAARRALKMWARARLVDVHRGRPDSLGRASLRAITVHDPRAVPCPQRGELAIIGGDPTVAPFRCPSPAVQPNVVRPAAERHGA